MSALFKTIPKDCQNSKLLITKSIIEGDRSRFLILVGNGVPHLTLSIKAKEHCMPISKHIIDNMNSAFGEHSDKRSRTGKFSRTTTGKCHLIDGI